MRFGPGLGFGATARVYWILGRGLQIVEKEGGKGCVCVKGQLGI
jgi:hypothetical protein